MPGRSSRTRVAFDVGPLAGPRTGIGVAVEALRGALAARPDVVLTPYLTSFRARPPAGVRRLPLPAAVALRTWAALDRPRVDRWLGDVEVIHGTNYTVPPSRHPRIVSVYDCWALDNPGRAHPDVRLAARELRRAVTGGAVIHACSAATASAVRRHFPSARIETVLLAPVPLARPSATPPLPGLAGHPFVLATGTIERRKNVPMLLRAFATLAAGDADLHLVIAGGDGDDRPVVDAVLASLPPEVSRRVVLAGYVDEAARSWLLQHARVLAYPSLDEGFGFPVLDAIQTGLPIVAADVGSLPEVAGPCALYCDPGDAGSIAERLHHALHDDAAREAMTSAGPGHLAQFSWERTAAAMASLYHELAEGGR